MHRPTAVKQYASDLLMCRGIKIVTGNFPHSANIITNFNISEPKSSGINCITLYQMPSFYTGSNWKLMQMTKYNFQIKTYFVKDAKYCWKKRKCWLPSFSPFPTMFSKSFNLRVVKSREGVVKG